MNKIQEVMAIIESVFNKRTIICQTNKDRDKILDLAKDIGFPTPSIRLATNGGLRPTFIVIDEAI